VRKSTSDLLTANCDEFIFYDELVQERKKRRPARKPEAQPQSGKAAANKPERPPDAEDARRLEGVQVLVETVEALIAERGEENKLWASMAKQTLKRRRPDFSESAYGYSSFRELLEAAHASGQLVVERDEKSGNYLLRLGHRED
jgi:hypothetical protein